MRFLSVEFLVPPFFLVFLFFVFFFFFLPPGALVVFLAICKAVVDSLLPNPLQNDNVVDFDVGDDIDDDKVTLEDLVVIEGEKACTVVSYVV